MAFCHRIGYGCVRDEVRLLELARESSEKGSRYGQLYLGYLLEKGRQGPDALYPFSYFLMKGPKIKQKLSERSWMKGLSWISLITYSASVCLFGPVSTGTRCRPRICAHELNFHLSS
jgi:hypothetical protein